MKRPDSSPHSVLVVDDDDVFRGRLIRAFADRGYEVRGAPDALVAMELAREDSPEYAVVDLRMPGPSGLELVSELLRVDPTTQIVVLTGYGSIATALDAVKRGAVHYLAKPADLDEILAALERRPGQADEAASAAVPSLARVEWEHINRVLTDCGGNISQAARLLGLHRRSLQRKLAKYPVPR